MSGLTGSTDPFEPLADGFKVRHVRSVDHGDACGSAFDGRLAAVVWGEALAGEGKVGGPR